MNPNPFAPPDSDRAALPPPSHIRLYSPGALLGFSILLSPLVGGALAAINWTRLGEHRRARTTLLFCYLPTLAVGLASARLGDLHAVAFRSAALLLSIGLGSWLRSSFIEPYQRHLEQGGAKGSVLWAAVASVGLLLGIALIAGLVLMSAGVK